MAFRSKDNCSSPSGEPILLQLQHQNHPVQCVFRTSGMLSTSGVFCTSGGIISTSGDTMSTSGDIMSTPGVFSTLEGYHEYIRGIS